MKLSVSPAIGFAILLGVGFSFHAGATPPPPPPPEARISYDGIDRLHFMEGDWEGDQSAGTGSTTFAIARRVGRFGPGQDHLLIGAVLGHSMDSHPGRPLQGGDIIIQTLEILTFDPVRGGYWVFAPGYFGERQSIARGHDEPVNIAQIGPTEIVWTQRLSDGRERTIHVNGDVWDETLVYNRADGSREPILEEHLRRFPGATQWGTVVPAPGAQAPASH